MNWFANKKILVPIDFGEQAKQAIDTSLLMADSPADIHVVHVAPDLTVSSPEVVWETLSDDVRRANIENSFWERFSDAEYQGLDFQVLFGDAGHSIADHAEEIHADVIVMPSHGRTGLKRLLVGSVTERVVRLAHCPVIVLRK